MDFDLLKLNLDELRIELEQFKNTANIDNKVKEYKELEEKTLKEGFWEDSSSSEVLQKMKFLDDFINKFNNIYSKYVTATEFFELSVELDDKESFEESKNICNELKNVLEKLKIGTLLNEQYDSNNSILTIHPGAGGTESQDWVEMLYRMYTKWAFKNSYELELIDLQNGDEAGIKSVSFLVKGMNSYGYLKGEKGIHRLVRISPFDSGGRRHTSFAAVDVIPEIKDNITIEIKSEDLQIDTFRASGAGGQHVNKTDSAIRIKHIPSGIVVACQMERSQTQNKEYALKMLKSKLYQLEQEKKLEQMKQIKGEAVSNSWGNQIRSYVFCPYTLAKDHRTNFEIGNIQSVMDGDIDKFIYEYLKFIKS